MFLGPPLPFPLQTAGNPQAPSKELWDSILDGLRNARPFFVQAAIPGIFGVTAGIEVDPATLQRYERMIDQADAVAIERCIQLITAKDFTEEVKALNDLDVGFMCIHGDSDQGSPYEATTKLIKELVPKTSVKLYTKAAHGECSPDFILHD